LEGYCSYRKLPWNDIKRYSNGNLAFSTPENGKMKIAQVDEKNVRLWTIPATDSRTFIVENTD
jgi:hypothetical protein